LKKGGREEFPGRPLKNARGLQEIKSCRKGEKIMRARVLLLGVLLILGMGTPAASEEKKDILVVDKFSNGANEKGIPQGWAMEKDLGPQSKIELGQEKDIHFLHLLSENDAFGIKKDMSFDIRKYPYLTWRWKATRLPKGGDIRKRETDDQAGQIYVLFPKFPAMVNTRSMGYIWDTVTPAGTPGTSTAYSKMKYVVLQSGAEKLGQWTWETRNVYEDYKKNFQEDPPQAGGVLLYINTQHTQSSGEIHYADIFFSAQPPKDLK
jgi:hypothetical protein